MNQYQFNAHVIDGHVELLAFYIISMIWYS